MLPGGTCMPVWAPELTTRTMDSRRRNADAGKQPKALSAQLGRAGERQPSGRQRTSDLHRCEPGVGQERPAATGSFAVVCWVVGAFRARSSEAEEALRCAASNSEERTW